MSQQLPQPFGKYVLLNKIAMGGMAEIFRAKTVGAEGFEKEVVIKRILPHYSEEEAFRTMFIDEAKVSAGLNHPNIVQIFDFDKEGETLYIAMEYVEGKDLKRVMDTGKKLDLELSVPQIVHVIMETCKGLHYAHTKKSRGVPLNIVHRDVSPHNVMVSFDGEVKVMDFGIAKAAARSTKTKAGTVKGKCAYMSPEQARGKELDSRSDMFAVGVMMWEMLTGERLFTGDSDFETLSNVLKAEAPAPSSRNPAVPPELDAIVLKCLNKDRDDRQKDCRELARELEGWMYANVSNPEEGELDGFMHQMFTDDIAALREMQSADQHTQFLEASAQVRAQRGGSSSSVQRLSSASNIDAVALNDARTVALSASEARAAIDAAANVHADRTVALDPASLSSTGIGGHADEPPKKSKTGLIVAVLVLLLAAAGGGYWFMTQKNGTPSGKPPEQASNSGNQGKTTGGGTAASADGQATATDGAATNGKADGGAPTDGSTGGKPGADDTDGGTDGKSTDRSDGKADGKDGDGDGTADGAETDGGTATDGTANTPPKPAKSKVTFAAVPADATIRARGQTATGKLELEAHVGDVIAVVVEHGEYKSVIREVKVDSPVKRVDLAMTEKKEVKAPEVSMAKLEFTVLPKSAKLSINGQAQPAMAEGIYQLSGFKVGEDITVEVAADKHEAQKETLRITVAELKKTYTLQKKKTNTVQTGPGTAHFNAKPWARVTAGGKSCTTPCSLQLTGPKGYRATFSQGSKSKSKGFRIKPGKKVSVYVDMTN